MRRETRVFTQVKIFIFLFHTEDEWVAFSQRMRRL